MCIAAMKNNVTFVMYLNIDILNFDFYKPS